MLLLAAEQLYCRSWRCFPKVISTVRVPVRCFILLQYIFKDTLLLYSSTRTFSCNIEKHFLLACVMIKMMQSKFRLHPIDHLSIRHGALSLFVQLSPLIDTTHLLYSSLHPGLTTHMYFKLMKAFKVYLSKSQCIVFSSIQQKVLKTGNRDENVSMVVSVTLSCVCVVCVQQIEDLLSFLKQDSTPVASSLTDRGIHSPCVGVCTCNEGVYLKFPASGKLQHMSQTRGDRDTWNVSVMFVCL